MKLLGLLQTVSLTTLTLLQTTYAQGPNQGYAQRPNQGLVFEQLDLSAEQKDKINDLRSSFQKESQSLRDALQRTREDFRSAKRGTASAEEVSAKFKAFQDAQSKMQALRLQHHLKIRELLTDDQRETFNAWMDRRGSKGRNRQAKDR